MLATISYATAINISIFLFLLSTLFIVQQNGAIFRFLSCQLDGWSCFFHYVLNITTEINSLITFIAASMKLSVRILWTN